MIGPPLDWFYKPFSGLHALAIVGVLIVDYLLYRLFALLGSLFLVWFLRTKKQRSFNGELAKSENRWVPKGRDERGQIIYKRRKL